MLPHSTSLIASKRANRSTVESFLQVFAFSSLLYLWQHWQLRAFLFHDQNFSVVAALFVVWAIALALIIVRQYLKLSLLVSYLASLALLHPLQPGVEYYLFHLTNFWLCFLFAEDAWFARRKTTTSPTTAAIPVWPLWCLGFNLALLFSAAGYTKLLDPFWQRGEGLRFVANLPWIHSISSESLAAISPILPASNYLIIAVELLALPLFSVRSTRKYIVYCWLIFFLALLWPLRLSFIAYFGLLACCAVMIFLRSSSAANTVQPPRAETTRILLAAVLLLLGFLATVIPHAKLSSKEFRAYPGIEFLEKNSSHAVTPNPTRNNNKQVAASKNTLWSSSAPARKFVRLLTKATLHISPMYVFSFREFLGLSAYRVEVVFNDGSRQEPFQVFDSRARAGAESAGLLATRWLQSAYYSLSRLSPCINFKQNRKIMRTVRGLCSLAQSRADHSRQSIQSIEIYLAEIRQDLSLTALSQITTQNWNLAVRCKPDDNQTFDLEYFKLPHSKEERIFIPAKLHYSAMEVIVRR